MKFRFVFIFLTIEGANSVLLGKVVGSLIRVYTVVAKFRPFGMSHFYQIGTGPHINIQEGVGFGDVLAGGRGGENKLELF